MIRGRRTPARRRTGPRRTRPPAPRRRGFAVPALRMWSSARGMDADEVLPEYLMSSATTMSSRAPLARSFFAIASTMRRFAWWGISTSTSDGLSPATSSARMAIGAICGGRPPENRLALLVDELLLASSRSGRPGRRRCPRRPGRSRLVGRADDRGAGAVGEDDRVRAVDRVDRVGELLRADDQHLLRRAAPDQVGGDAEAVAEPGAGGVEVERAGAGMPIRAATWAAAFGICVGMVQFGRITVSTSDGSTRRRPARRCRRRRRSR